MLSPVFEIRLEIPAVAVPAVEEILAGREATEWMLQDDLPSGRTWLTGYFSSRNAAEAGWSILRTVLGPDVVRAEPTVREMVAADWRESYREHFTAWRLGRLHWVPVWEKKSYEIPAGDEVVWLDPGMAFGTGNHETTRLCCERLVEFVDRRRAAGADLPRLRVVDAGCGSGILAISAAKLGAEYVFAFDLDEDAIRVSRENARLNRIEDRIEFVVADLDSGLRERRADLLLANIQADVLMRHATALVTAVAPGGTLVLSGVLSEEVATVKARFARCAQNRGIEVASKGDWAVLTVEG